MCDDDVHLPGMHYIVSSSYQSAMQMAAMVSVQHWYYLPEGRPLVLAPDSPNVCFYGDFHNRKDIGYLYEVIKTYRLKVYFVSDCSVRCFYGSNPIHVLYLAKALGIQN